MIRWKLGMTSQCWGAGELYGRFVEVKISLRYALPGNQRASMVLPGILAFELTRTY